MKKRLTYEAPEGELILVQFEENLLTSGEERSLKFGGNGDAGGDSDVIDQGSF